LTTCEKNARAGSLVLRSPSHNSHLKGAGATRLLPLGGFAAAFPFAAALPFPFGGASEGAGATLADLAAALRFLALLPGSAAPSSACRCDPQTIHCTV